MKKNFQVNKALRRIRLWVGKRRINFGATDLFLAGVSDTRKGGFREIS
jgi:hypothetical protein